MVIIFCLYLGSVLERTRHSIPLVTSTIQKNKTSREGNDNHMDRNFRYCYINKARVVVVSNKQFKVDLFKNRQGISCKK